jgi:hypothetical protein
MQPLHRLVRIPDRLLITTSSFAILAALLGSPFAKTGSFFRVSNTAI